MASLPHSRAQRLQPLHSADADVLDRAAEACHLVALEVAQGDQHVGVHQRAAHQGRLAVFAVGNGNLDVVRAPQAVGDDHVTAGGHAVEAVQLGVGQVVEGVLAAAGVERVAIGQKGPAAQIPDEIGHGPDVVGPQIRVIAQLAEVHLDGGELAFKVDIADAGGPAQLLQLFPLADARAGSEIGEIDLCLFHDKDLLSLSVTGSPGRWPACPLP